MKCLKGLFLLMIVLSVASCSGGKGSAISNLFNSGDSGSNPVDPTIPPSQIETQKLVNAVQADPIYKIDDSEIEMLKTEGIITDQDQKQLKTIQ